MQKVRDFRALLGRKQQIERALQDVRRERDQKAGLIAVQEQLIRELENQGESVDLNDPEQLELLTERLDTQLIDHTDRLESDQQDRIRFNHTIDTYREQVDVLRKKAPQWLVAREKLEKLEEMTGDSLETPAQISQLLQKTLEQERQLEQLEQTGRYGPYEKELRHKHGHLVPVRLHGQLFKRKNQESYNFV